MKCNLSVTVKDTYTQNLLFWAPDPDFQTLSYSWTPLEQLEAAE